MSRKVVVIGGGLAGLCAALEARAAGATVTIIEKESKLGGNSAKASSGMNGTPTSTQSAYNVSDRTYIFVQDTLASGKGLCDLTLVERLVLDSASAIEWIEQQGIALRSVLQCGGHSRARTHRIAPDPSGRVVPIGSGIMSALQKKVQLENITLLLSSPVKKLMITGDQITGVLLKDNKLVEADSVVLTTGGYAGKPKDNSVLKEFAPRYVQLPTTNGPWAIGDGIRVGQDAGAAVRDMDKVQIHPTGFVDPNDPGADTKFLAPEALRASGGILMNSHGLRFTNELDRRDVVSYDIFRCDTDNQTADQNGKWGGVAYLILSEESVSKYDPASMKFYETKGLFHRASSIGDLAKFMALDPAILNAQFELYDQQAKNGNDQFGKSVFPSTLNNSASYWVARVTPSCHYSMGGLRIDQDAHVLKEINENQYTPIEGFYAAGEVTGGVHGANRLAGNSLLECVVFGRIAGQNAAGRS